MVPRCDAPKHDTYEMEIARLARVSPEVLDVQKKAGLSEEDMKASLAELKVLRARVSRVRPVHIARIPISVVVLALHGTRHEACDVPVLQ